MTLHFMEHDLEEAKNLKLVLCAFEQLSGLKINFHKSELFLYGEAQSLYKSMLRFSGVKRGHCLLDIGGFLCITVRS